MDLFAPYAGWFDWDYGDWQDDLLLLEQLAARCGSPLLELGCGTGRALVPLARGGFDLTGVDSSAAMLDRAREALVAADVAGRVTLVQQDVRHLDLDGRFNLAFMAMNSFHHLPSAADQELALRAIFQYVHPGGLLLLDLWNPDMGLLLDARGQVILDRVESGPETGGCRCKSYAVTADLDAQLLNFTYLIDEVDNQGAVRRTLFPFTIRYLFRAELELLLRHTGWQIEAIYGSYDLDEFVADGAKMVAVARRPK